jgi:N-methylhydantoinase B
MVALGVEELGPKPGHIPLSARDVLGYAFQGGGGYGDPLKRNPEAVLADVANGHVTEKAAAEYYGVILRNHNVDAEMTTCRREAIRLQRLDGIKPKRPLGEGDLRVTGKRFACSCGYDLGPGSGNWKAAAQTKVVSPQTYGPHIRIHPALELREHICRECGSLLEAEVVRKSDDSLVTVALES